MGEMAEACDPATPADFPLVEPDKFVDSDGGGGPDALVSDLALHNFTVQSTEHVKNKSEKSTGPTRGWKCRPITGPV